MADDLRSIETGRDDAGKFISKQRISQIAMQQIAKLRKQNETAKRSVDNLTKSYAKQAQTIEKLARTQQLQYATQTKALKDGERQVYRQQKAQAALMKAQTKQADSYRKMQAQTMKAMQRAAGGASGGGGGMLGPIAGIVSATAIIAATKSLISYTTELARTRDMARALGGAFRDVNAFLPNKRDAELFGQYAQQAFGNRFAGGTEIQGLLQLRNSLQEKLGPEAGKDLTLNLTQSFKDDEAALQQFLAMASVDVPKALEAFQGQDIQNFSTALGAVNGQASELSKTAWAMESAWQQVQDSWERFVTDVVGQNGVDLRNIVQDIAAGVVDLINAGRHLAAEMAPVFKFLRDGFRMVRDAMSIGSTLEAHADLRKVAAVDKQLDPLIARQRAAALAGDKATVAALRPQIRELIKQRGALMGNAVDRFSDGVKDITLGAAQHVDTFTLNMKKAQDATKKERKELETMLTPIQQAALDITRIKQQLNVTNAEIQTGQSRMAVTGAAGQGAVVTATTSQLDDKLKLLRQEYADQQKIIDENAKKGVDLKQARIALLDIEREINTTLAERNNLQATYRKTVSDLQGQMVSLEQSRQRAMESTPLGQMGSLQQQYQVVAAIDQKRDILLQQMKQLDAIQNKTLEQERERVDLEIELNNLTADRNSMLQAQTRGYLDAVQAQAFGAGRFEKIIITQEENVAAALGKGLAERNKLLGNVGAPSGLKPFAWGADIGANIAGAQGWAQQLARYHADQVPGMPVPVMPKVMQDVAGMRANRIMPVPQAPSVETEPRSTSQPTTRPSAPRPSRPYGGDIADKLDQAADALKDAARQSRGEQTVASSAYSWSRTMPLA